MAARTPISKPAPARPAPVPAAARRRSSPFPAAAPPAARADLDTRVADAERFGHHFGSVPMARPMATPAVAGGPPSSAAPIQRGLLSTIGGWFGYGQQAEAQREAERQAEQRKVAIRRAQAEAAAKRQADADKRSKELHEQEHKAYRRLDEIKGGRQHADERQRLMQQLDGIQRAHSEHIEHLHRNDLKLWTPDRDQLDQAGRNRLDEAWDELRHGSGLIRTPTGPGTADINKDLRSMHARLLSGARGRSLLYQLLDKEGPATRTAVNILPRDPMTARERRENREASQALAPLEPQLARKHGELIALMDAEGLGHMRNMATHPWRDPQNQAKMRRLAKQYSDLNDRIAPLRVAAQPRPAAEAGPVAGGLGANTYTAAGAPGPGSASDVNLMSGIRDSEYLNQDAQGRHIPAPAFIVYGHELIHALHNKRGTDSTGVNQDQYAQGPLARWSNREEHDTIAHTVNLSENLLRAEHGLTQRGSHFGIAREDLEAQRGGGGGRRRRRGR